MMYFTKSTFYFIVIYLEWTNIYFIFSYNIFACSFLYYS